MELLYFVETCSNTVFFLERISRTIEIQGV